MDKHLQKIVLKQLQLTDILLKVATILENNGISFLVLKGVHLAYFYYTKPEDRDFGDIDIFINKRDVDIVIQLLENELQAAPHFKRHHTSINKFSNTEALQIKGAEIDIHWDFSPYKRYPINTDELFKNVSYFYVNGHKLAGLNPENLLYHECIHALKGNYEIYLKHLTDVSIIIKKDQINWSDLFSKLKKSGALAGSYYFFKAAQDITQAKIPPEFLQNLKTNSIKLTILSNYIQTTKLPLLKYYFPLWKQHLILTPLLQDYFIIWVRSVILFFFSKFFTFIKNILQRNI